MKAARVFDVGGRVALITGAAQGLGRAMAAALADNGAVLWLLDQDDAALDRTARSLRAGGAAVTARACDVGDARAVAAAVAALLDQHGRLDICIANAGISDPDRAPVHETSAAGWQRVLDVNLTGVFNTCKAALGPMRAQRRGKIVTVASMWGLIAPAGLQPRPAYAATKAGVVNLTREIALQYAAEGIQANTLCPGFFRTESRPRDAAQAAAMAGYTPMGRIADPAEIAGATLFLCSSASDFVTGSTVVIDGGVTAG